MTLNLNSGKEKRKSPITKGDVALIAFLCLVIILLFTPSFFAADEKLTAYVYLDGEVVEAVEFSELSESRKITVGGCEILLQNDGVSFVESECRDKLCIKKGKLRRKGDTMACVPEKVVVTLKSEKKDDFHIATY